MSGRPRNKEIDEVIHQSTLELLAEVGYQKVSMAEVARKSNTAITTLYRRYENVHALIIGSLRAEFATLNITQEDTGSLVTDLKAIVTEIATGVNPLHRTILSALLLPMQNNPDLASFIHNELSGLNGQGHWQAIVRRAVERGELPTQTIAPEILFFVIPSVIFQAIMVNHIDVHKTSILDDLVHFVLLPALKGQGLASHSEES